jgi:cysteinyl-tRNA synthetase
MSIHFRQTAVLTVLLFSVFSCEDTKAVPDRDFRQDMRDFVKVIHDGAVSENPDFIVIPQNGQELLSLNGESGGEPAADYMAVIHGVGREDLYYGYDEDDEATPFGERSYMLDFLDLAEEYDIEVLTTDYCSTPSKMDDSYQSNAQHGFISFAADHRELDNIPTYPETPFNENSADITTLGSARNFLYLLNPDGFNTKTTFLEALQATNYDMFIMDLYFQGNTALSADDITSLKTKANGGQRLVIAYMSIGEAEDYREYWDADWSSNFPDWIHAENPDWEGNFKVFYWEPVWQAIIATGSDSYLSRIIQAGFDGVYLDIIDAFEYFEDIRG